MQKCQWALADSLSEYYHDTQWGVPVHNDRLWFEMLILEGAQAGLSWVTVLKKRAAYQQVFAGFDAAIVATFDNDKILALMANSGIIRNRLKIQSAILNAQAFLQIQKEFGSFDQYIWRFVNGTPLQNCWHQMSEVPTSTPESIAMSKDLLRRGFKFVGPTICYAFMQATGLVNDHTRDCFRHSQLS